MKYCEDAQWVSAYMAERKRLQIEHADALAEIANAKALGCRSPSASRLAEVRARLSKLRNGPQPTDEIPQ